MPYHIPVMVNQTMDILITDKDKVYFDGTAGGGGHSSSILSRLSKSGRVIAFDRDMDAVTECQKRFSEDGRFSIHHSAFSNLNRFVTSNSLQGAIFDLGVSSHQLDTPNRGFSYQGEGNIPDMRMDRSMGGGAGQYIRQSSESALAKAFKQNADLSKSIKLAKAVKKQWEANPSTMAFRIAAQQVFGRNHNNLNRFLSRIFQAIRMEVNDEIEEIRTGLKAAVAALKAGGRIAVLTYHSVEDRAVKNIFTKFQKDCLCDYRAPVCVCGGGHRVLKKVTKKPLIPDDSEIQANHRARSAKLRVMEKLDKDSFKTK